MTAIHIPSTSPTPLEIHYESPIKHTSIDSYSISPPQPSYDSPITLHAIDALHSLMNLCHSMPHGSNFVY